MQNVLLVTYVWPPTGGVGVSRVLKLAKYLPRHGVTPAVLTVANPSVPLRDESLLADIPPGIEVLRARTFEPGYAAKQAAWKSAGTGQAATKARPSLAGRAAALARGALVPDPQILWQPDAQRVLARRLLSPAADDVVFITAPPFSMFLLAPTVRATRRAAVVLDYRDEWITLRTQYEMLGGLGRVLGGPLEAATLRCAHYITTATDAFRQNLLDRFPFLDPARVVTIENGYDPDEFPDPATLPPPPDDQFVVTYAGTVFKQNSPRGLIGALRLLHQREPALARRLRVRFIGRIVDTELGHFDGAEALGVERVGFIDKAKVTPALAASHMVLCILDEMPGAERIYPAKIFELMALGRPCLTLAPPGALAELVARHRLGPVLPPRDEAAIAAELERALRAHAAGSWQLRAAAVDIEQYDRRVIAGRFAQIFSEAARLAGRPVPTM